MLRVHDFLFSLSNDASLGLFSLSAPANSIQRILIVLKKWKGQEVNDDVNHLYADRCPIRAQAGSKDQNRHEKRAHSATALIFRNPSFLSGLLVSVLQILAFLCVPHRFKFFVHSVRTSKFGIAVRA